MESIGCSPPSRGVVAALLPWRDDRGRPQRRARDDFRPCEGWRKRRAEWPDAGAGVHRVVAGDRYGTQVPAASPASSDAEKEARGAGHGEARAIRRYLTALADRKPKRGRKPTPAGLQRRLDAIGRALTKADPVQAVQLGQERLDLAIELARLTSPGPSLADLEQEFVAVAASYSRRKGISYAAWRESGVPAGVLARAGIGRSFTGRT